MDDDGKVGGSELFYEVDGVKQDAELHLAIIEEADAEEAKALRAVLDKRSSGKKSTAENGERMEKPANLPYGLSPQVLARVNIQAIRSRHRAKHLEQRRSERAAGASPADGQEGKRDTRQA